MDSKFLASLNDTSILAGHALADIQILQSEDGQDIWDLLHRYNGLLGQANSDLVNKTLAFEKNDDESLSIWSWAIMIAKMHIIFLGGGFQSDCVEF